MKAQVQYYRIQVPDASNILNNAIPLNGSPEPRSEHLQEVIF